MRVPIEGKEASPRSNLTLAGDVSMVHRVPAHRSVTRMIRRDSRAPDAIVVDDRLTLAVEPESAMDVPGGA